MTSMKRILILFALVSFFSSEALAVSMNSKGISTISIAFDKEKKKKKKSDCCKKDEKACCKKSDEGAKAVEESSGKKGACCKKDAANCSPDKKQVTN